MNQDIIRALDGAGVKPTANRILVLKAVTESHHPVSVMELEEILETLDKSSIFRVLTLLQTSGMVHAVEDGRGVVKYELCHGHGHCSSEVLHVHFYCEECHQVTCLEDTPTPSVTLPNGYEVHSVNYMLKGICPDCRRSRQAGV